MNIIKNKCSNVYCYQHQDRTFNEKGEYQGNSSIDPDRSYLNFNLSDNNRHHREQMRYVMQKTKKKVRKNAVLSFSTIVTLPTIYFERARSNPQFVKQFFQDIYQCLLEYYGLQASDVASSWVHMDETTPHMHFIATPLITKEDGTQSLYFDKVVDRHTYHDLHQTIEQMMVAKGYDDIQLLNDATKDGNKTIRQLKNETIAKDLAKLSPEIIDAKEQLINLKDEIWVTNRDLMDKRKELQAVNKEVRGIDPDFLRLCKTYAPLVKEALYAQREKLKPQDQAIVQQYKEKSPLARTVTDPQKNLQ